MARSGPEAWLGRLDAWLEPFLAALPRAEQRRWAPLYVRSLLLPGERKSVEPVEAAAVLLCRHARPCALKSWGRALADRVGAQRANVAVARTLAVLLHRLWRSGEEVRWPEPAAVSAAAA
jgi:DDE superfamily endonuclease